MKVSGPLSEECTPSRNIFNYETSKRSVKQIETGGFEVGEGGGSAGAGRGQHQWPDRWWSC